MASIQHIDDDRWRVRVSTGNGKTRSRTFTARGPREAKRKAAAVETELRTELLLETDAGTVTELANDWLTSRQAAGRSPGTLREYRRHTQRFVDSHGHMPAADVTGRTIDLHYRQLATAGLSPAMIQHAHATLRAMFRWGHRNRELPADPTSRATPPAHRTPRVNPPTDATMRLLLETVRGDWGRAVKLTAFTGMRRGEIVALQWTDITPTGIHVQRSVLDLHGGGMTIKAPKSGASRTVAIGNDITQLLQQQHRETQRIGNQHNVTSPWVFPAWRADPTGQTPHKAGWLSLMWSRHRLKHNATSVRLHDLRHWYATRALAAGVPINSVAAQLGHAQTSTTLNIYGHAVDHGQHAAALAAESLLNDNNP